ncbi:MAG: GNAT family N-acetyltransferase, partial [Chloroflexi bacterium]|nr:GNAT family N-acetyltransferase [Chloroflexota bacterium]
MLVKLYRLPEIAPVLAQVQTIGVDIRQAHPSEKNIVSQWVKHHFTESWAVGSEVALEQHPITCYIAIQKQ